MTFAEKISLAVAVFAAIAGWLMWSGIQPSLDRRQWAIPVAMLALVAAIAVSLAVATFAPKPGTVAPVSPPTVTNPLVYQAPREPEPLPTATATTIATTTTTATAATAPAPTLVSVPPPALTATRDERERRAAAIERQRRQALALSASAEWSKAAGAWRQFIDDYGGHDRAADHAAYYNLGVAYESLHAWSDAAGAFELARVVDDAKSDTKNLLRLGRCYAKLGRWKESVAAYEDVLKIEPSNAVAKRCLLWALKQQLSGE